MTHPKAPPVLDPTHPVSSPATCSLVPSCQQQGPGMFFLCFLELHNRGG